MLHKARDDGSIAALAAGAAAANPPAPVQVAPGAAAQPEAQVQLQQPQQPLAPLPPAQQRTAAAPQPAAGVPPGGSPARAAAGAAVASPPAAAAAAALAALAAAPVSGEQMVWVLEDALRRTPGLMDRDIAAFMGRWVQLLQTGRSRQLRRRIGGNLPAATDLLPQVACKTCGALCLALLWHCYAVI